MLKLITKKEYCSLKAIQGTQSTELEKLSRDKILLDARVRQATEIVERQSTVIGNKNQELAALKDYQAKLEKKLKKVENKLKKAEKILKRLYIKHQITLHGEKTTDKGELIYNEAEKTLFVGQTITIGTCLYDGTGRECYVKEFINSRTANIVYSDGSTGELSLEELAIIVKDDITSSFKVKFFKKEPFA